MADFMNGFSSMAAAILGSCAYELGILMTFFVSWAVWHTLVRQGFLGKQHLSSKQAPGMQEHPDGSKRGGGHTSWDEARLHQQRGGKEAPNPKRMAAQIIALSQDQYTRALRLYRDLVRSGHDKEILEEQFYFALIQASIRVGNADVVQELLNTMKQLKVPRSLQFFQSTLKLLASKHLYKVCLMMHSLFKDEIPPDRTVCSCIAFAATECNEPQIALQIVGHLHKLGEGACGRDYQNIFRHYAKSGEYEAAAQLLEQLQKDGVQIETIIVNIVLAACVTAKRLEKADEILLKFSSVENGLDAVSYNTVLKGYSQAKDLERCFELVGSMATCGIAPDDVTYGTLLDACIADHDLDRATQVIDRLIASGCPMNTVLYTTFMKGFVRADMLDKAMEMYHMMQRTDGPGAAKPDIITYSILVKGNCDKRRLEQALQLLDDMVRGGVEPDDIIVNHLLDGCCHVSNCELGEHLFGDLVVSGRVKPSMYTLAAMIKLYGKCGRCDAAAKLVDDMETRFQEKPGVIIYTCLMSGCIRHKRVDEAMRAYGKMKAEGLQPDKMTYQTLLQGCTQGQEWDKVFMLAQEALQHKVGGVPTDALNASLSAMLSRSQLPQAGKLHRLMIQNKIPVTAQGVARRLRPTGWQD